MQVVLKKTDNVPVSGHSLKSDLNSLLSLVM